jgi:hypothetical protein
MQQRRCCRRQRRRLAAARGQTRPPRRPRCPTRNQGSACAAAAARCRPRCPRGPAAAGAPRWRGRRRQRRRPGMARRRAARARRRGWRAPSAVATGGSRAPTRPPPPAPVGMPPRGPAAAVAGVERGVAGGGGRGCACEGAAATPRARQPLAPEAHLPGRRLLGVRVARRLQLEARLCVAVGGARRAREPTTPSAETHARCQRPAPQACRPAAPAPRPHR